MNTAPVAYAASRAMLTLERSCRRLTVIEFDVAMHVGTIYAPEGGTRELVRYTAALADRLPRAELRRYLRALSAFLAHMDAANAACARAARWQHALQRTARVRVPSTLN